MLGTGQAIRVFISYAWEDDAYRALVKQLATRLREDGIDARLDAWHVDTDIPSFMARETENAQRILILCSPSYKSKVKAMQNGEKITGVGWEQQLLSASMWSGDIDQKKVVACLFRGEWRESAPLFLSALPWLDLRPAQDSFEANYRQMLQRLSGHTEQAPSLGTLPADLEPQPVPALRGTTTKSIPNSREIQTQNYPAHTSKLPATDSTLIGRDRELGTLNTAWQSGARFVQIIAPGGTGKTALMTKWYKQHVGKVPILGYSFYRQGTLSDGPGDSPNKSNVSSDGFLDYTVKSLRLTPGRISDEAVTTDAKIEVLIEHFRTYRTLLILDGLEPLQDHASGELRDFPIKDLLRELATQNAGLVLCTTRVRLTDVPDEEAAVALDLDNLTEEDGARYLKEKFHIDGSDEQLRAASREYGNHALALTLLGTHLEMLGGDISKGFEIDQLPVNDDKAGSQARRVMGSYWKLFQDKPEGDILRALGFFDRPAESEAIKLVLSGQPDAKALARLRKSRLILSDGAFAPIDCHPLVREYFGAINKSTDPKGYQAGHSRLFDYYCKLPRKDRPDTIEELGPLFHAVAHGCRADRYQEAFDLYQERIRRGAESYLIKKLGAFGTNLALLAHFFEQPWNQPVAALKDTQGWWLVNNAAYSLRALGRLIDAVEPTQVSGEAAISGGEEDWKQASTRYSNLSELLLTLGRISEAIAAARQSIDYADRSGDAFERLSNRASLADALHQSGSPQSPELETLSESATLFADAERMQAEWQPGNPVLYSLRGFQYCDLLLDSTLNEANVLNRATQTLRIAQRNNWLLDIGLDHLPLGRAHPQGSRDSCHHLDQAVIFLRRAGTLDQLPRALLIRGTEADLAEVYRIATRSGMRLHLTDYHLAIARGKAQQGSREEALSHLQKAEALIQEAGYHRRDPDAAALRQQLGPPSQIAR